MNISTSIVPSHSSGDILAQIESHCRLKAEAALWAIERDWLLNEAADHGQHIGPRTQELIRSAKDDGCVLWMLFPGYEIKSEAGMLVLSECFQCLAEATILTQSTLANSSASKHEVLHDLQLLAEAQSALRVAVEHESGRRDDSQLDAYWFLFRLASERRLYIERFMRLDDPADPDRVTGLLERIRNGQKRGVDRREVDNHRRMLFILLSDVAKSLLSDPSEVVLWNLLAQCVTWLIESGLQPSDVTIRKCLLPIIDDIPIIENESPKFKLVLREIDAYLARRGESTPEPTLRVWSADVATVRMLISDSTMVLVGGTRRPHASDRLIEAFGLSALDWIGTNEHESIDRFRARVKRADVSVVLLAIRWASHSFGELKAICDAAGKPFVRLPTGYNPNQVARQILAQCSGMWNHPDDQEADYLG